jgi:hypothetical protein
MQLSIGITTCRSHPEIHWIIESLVKQVESDEIELLVIDSNCKSPSKHEHRIGDKLVYYSVHPVMPNAWQGEYRVTKDQWWNVCCARNTFLCLAKHPNVAMIDDRLVLCDLWLQAVRDSVASKTIVCGPYEKRICMGVENGVIVQSGIVSGVDDRERHASGERTQCPGNWLYGCSIAMPLEWALHVNGYPEILCGGLGFEDVLFGLILENNHYPIQFDKRMRVIEDRTEKFLGEPMKRTSKERFSNDKEDKAHKALELVKTMKRSENPFGSLRELRERIQRGEPFPKAELPVVDWFDGQQVKDFA